MHLWADGSKNDPRTRVQKMLVISAIVTSETMAIGVQKTDRLLEVSPDDARRIFFETTMEIFHAVRKFKPEYLTNPQVTALPDDVGRFAHSTEPEIERRKPSAHPPHQPRTAVEYLDTLHLNYESNWHHRLQPHRGARLKSVPQRDGEMATRTPQSIFH